MRDDEPATPDDTISDSSPTSAAEAPDPRLISEVQFDPVGLDPLTGGGEIADVDWVNRGQTNPMETRQRETGEAR